MKPLLSHADIIALWPSKAEFGRAIGVGPRAAVYMAERGIARWRFKDVVEAAKARDVAAAAKRAGSAITVDLLKELAPPRTKRTANAQEIEA